jgi:hypothetical protein
MFDWMSSSFRREIGIRVLLAAALISALLCAGGALPAQATKGGVPALPDAASDHATPGNGAAPELPDAAVGGETDAGGQADVPDPQDPPQGGSPTGGANDVSSGPYDPDPADPGASGVGEPSGNGKSTDNNGNRPCAGCVGNADYKNPPGQLPDGSDDNKGYECDENEGVGKMNPAHSGCLPTGTTPPVKPPTVTPPTPPTPPTTPPVTPPAQVGNPPAQPPASPPSETEEEQGGGGVQGVEEAPDVPQPPQQPPVVEAIPVSAPIARTAQALPFTGGHALRLGLLGFLALVAGLGLARLLRIRSYA